LLGVLIGAWRGGRRTPQWLASAAVDAHYHLKDRTVTALRFLEKSPRTPLEEMQIADATRRLVQVDPRAVVPRGFPKLLVPAFGLFAAVWLLAWPIRLESPESPVERKPPERAPGPSAADTEPFDEAGARELRAQIKWRQAPPATVVTGRTHLRARETLEEVVSEAARWRPDPSRADGEATRPPP